MANQLRKILPRPSKGRVALLGIAERTVRAKYAGNITSQKRVKALNANVQTMGEWLKLKRTEKNFAPSHVAAKMGIATAIVSSWESGLNTPDSQQLTLLAAVLGFDAESFRKSFPS
jgi:DNA-binding transcriptional regulator YiaG